MAQSVGPPMGPMYGPSAIDDFHTMLHHTWEQYWAFDQFNFPGSYEASSGDIQHKHEVEDFIPNDAYTPAPTNLVSSIFSQEHTGPLESPDLISPGKSPSNSDGRQRPSPTQSDNQKRKSTHPKRDRVKPLRRNSSKQTQAKKAAGGVHENTKMDHNTHKAAERHLSPLQYNNDEYARKHQERNRHAANKSRIKKRVDEDNLESAKKDMEQFNRDLLTCASDLKSQVYDLRMKVLQHTNCNCALIQEYIANNANHYIKNLGN
jgi:hypothetical protein